MNVNLVELRSAILLPCARANSLFDVDKNLRSPLRACQFLVLPLLLLLRLLPYARACKEKGRRARRKNERKFSLSKSLCCARARVCDLTLRSKLAELSN